MRTIPLFLIALIVAIANSPTNIFQINDAPLIRRVVAIGSRLRAWSADLMALPLLANERGEAALDLLTLGLAGPRLRVLQQAHADTMREMKAIRDLITKEGRVMTADERTKVKGLEQQLDDIAEEMGLEKKAQDRERAQRTVDDATATATARAERASGLQVGRDLTLDDPKKGFKTQNEFLAEVMKSGQGRRTDARLESLRVVAAAGSDEQSGNEGQFGAFLVPMGFSPTLLQLTPEDDPTAALVTPVPMSNPIVNIPARTDKDHTTSVTGGLIVTRKRETIAGTSARMSLEQVALHANSVFGLSYSTEEIITDSPISFVAILSAGFRDQFSSHLFNERLNGLGGGEPLGVLNSPCVVSVAKETGQASKTIVTENIDKMVAASWKYGRAIWLANHDTFPSMQGLTRSVGVGGSLVNYLTYDPNGQAMLLGRPIFFSEYPATLGTVGDLILGVWSEYLHGTYQPLESAESIHVRFETHERTFKFWLRDDGQPWWKASLKPKRGASNLSPFVTLATR